MAAYKPAQMLAKLNTNPDPILVKQQPTIQERCTPITRENEIQVTATGEVSLAPDRCKATITISSSKEHVQEVKNSVSRRVDYVMQTLANHQIRDEHISTSKVLRKVDGFFQYNVEVTVTFSDHNKCQSICNFLVEKLDESVKVSSPDFSHGSEKLESTRRHASLMAVKNARQKAAEIGQFVNAKVGQPLSIKEESCNEWYGPADGPLELDGPLSVQQKIEQSTFHASVKVSASFVLKPKRSKDNKS